MIDGVRELWSLKVENNEDIQILLKDYELLKDILSVIDDEEQFEEISHDKKNRTKFLLKR